MRARFCLIGAGVLVLTGCGQGAAARPLADPTPVVVDFPASSAGGACELIEYPMVERAVGARFNVSAATELDGTESCVLRDEKVALPDLALSVTPTAADPAIFKQEAVPSGGQSVPGLGKSAYRLTSAPAKGKPAVAEVGWLSGDGRLITLHYTCASGANRAVADALAPKLVALAKLIEASGR